MKTDHILVTSDLSDEALRPCIAVAGLAKQWGARITLLYVMEDPPAALPMAPALSAPGVQERMKDARDKLEEQQRTLESDIESDVAVIAGPDTAAAIAQYVKTHDLGLVALSSHGRSGFKHLVLGSVAESILHRSPVPVLVFPQTHG